MPTKQKKSKIKEDDEELEPPGGQIQENQESIDISNEEDKQINIARINNFNSRLDNPPMTNSQSVRKEKQEALINDKEQIMLYYILQNLKQQGYGLNNAMITYFDALRDLYVYCGNDPISEQMVVPFNCIHCNQLQIKVRQEKKKLEELLIQEQKNKEETEETDQKYIAHQGVNNPRQNRVKERKIGEVVEKVALWRRFYQGFYDEKQKWLQMSLDVAAQKVGISKKTLDDYLLQIRCGKRYGFDFNEHLNQRIGKLRSFVKKNKQQENPQGNNVTRNSSPDHDEQKSDK